MTISIGGAELENAESNSPPGTCVNDNWSVLVGSAAPKQLSLTMERFRCIPESKTDADPYFSDNPEGCGSIALDEPTVEITARDVVNLVCTLDSVVRNPDGTTVHGGLEPGAPNQFTCVEI